MVSAIILAAGQSVRFGSAKLLQPWGKHTIIEQTVDNFRASKAGEVIVVLGSRADEVRKRLAGKRVKIVLNPDYPRGMSASVVAALPHVDAWAKAVMLALGDQPLVDSKIINALIDAFETVSKGIVIPVFKGRRGNPVIFDIKYRSELLELTGDVGGREVVARHPADVLEVEVDSPAVLADIDTPADYERQKKTG